MASGDKESPLRYYLALEGASREMLEAARSGDWDTVCRLEGACAVVIARLRRLNESQPLSDGEQPERLRILRAILVNDAEIRRIAGPGAESMERERGWPGPNITLH
ncbi:flagellar protein FliT [Ramlibacter sp. AW1]|uniref:Flagellar protein FliT n=2 Tax=Ramlibacter aurantiacus TaxID=2801330 RepID=A0A937D6Y8_9BURK|nr:flagellar protein FliT [Ramlibacter aurantiacus]